MGIPQPPTIRCAVAARQPSVLFEDTRPRRPSQVQWTSWVAKTAVEWWLQQLQIEAFHVFDRARVHAPILADPVVPARRRRPRRRPRSESSTSKKTAIVKPSYWSRTFRQRWTLWRVANFNTDRVICNIHMHYICTTCYLHALFVLFTCTNCTIYMLLAHYCTIYVTICSAFARTIYNVPWGSSLHPHLSKQIALPNDPREFKPHSCKC